jgi:glutathione-regulated potassium-efflux system ancillary protein KefG
MVQKRVLILFAHPALQRSRLNRRLIEGVDQIEGVTVNDLYERYPDFDIDIQHEQQLLLDHDVIIFHHPFFWYSTPAILKEWQDLVLEHGWAYGHGGTALKGKILFNVLSTGGREEAYQKEGYNRFTIHEFLLPIRQTAALCSMIYLPPYAVHGTHGMKAPEVEQHCRDYKRLLQSICTGTFNEITAKRVSRLNFDLDSVISE